MKVSDEVHSYKNSAASDSLSFYYTVTYASVQLSVCVADTSLKATNKQEDASVPIYTTNTLTFLFL